MKKTVVESLVDFINEVGENGDEIHIHMMIATNYMGYDLSIAPLKCFDHGLRIYIETVNGTFYIDTNNIEHNEKLSCYICSEGDSVVYIYDEPRLFF